MKNSLRKVFIFAVIAFCLSVSPALAEDTVDSLQPWEGKFVSLSSLIQDSQMDPLYLKIAQAAQKAGKDYTAGQVKNFNRKMYQTNIQGATITSNQISYVKEGDPQNPIIVQYVYQGIKETKFMEHDVKWHVFVSPNVAPEAEDYRYLIAVPIHAHKGGQPHWHFRYGKTSVEDLIGNPDLQNWWPTFVSTDFNLDDFIKTIDPKIMAKMLP